MIFETGNESKDLSEFGNEKAPEGMIFQCCACGKKATWIYGFDDKDQKASDSEWDESCMFNACLVEEGGASEKPPHQLGEAGR